MTKAHIPEPVAFHGARRSRLSFGFGIWSLGFGIFLAAVSAAGCAKAQAKGAAAGPPLEVPQPPPRVLAPVEVTAAAPPPESQPAAAAPRTPPRPPVRRPETERPEQPAPAAATAPPPPVEPAPAAPPALRPAPSAQEAAAEKGVRDTLARAARDLARVDYGKLNADARAQYDQSKRFAQQAEQAVRDRNFVFAATLADKAATLAAELLSR
jgi:type IV secretory pathway VirB10-like protein